MPLFHGIVNTASFLLASSHKLNEADLMPKGEESGGKNSYGEGKMKEAQTIHNCF